MLGDAGTDNSDASYTGDVSDSSFSLDYYRQKAREFQGVLNQVDANAQAARGAGKAGGHQIGIGKAGLGLVADQGGIVELGDRQQLARGALQPCDTCCGILFNRFAF